MIKIGLLKAFQLVTIISLNCIAEVPTIKIFTWWEFIAPKVTQKLKNSGFKIEVTEYRSNEVALSKLLTKNPGYDVVIVSNWVLKILENNQLLDQNSLKKIGEQRNYHSFLKKLDQKFTCLPYLWATTTYAMDVRSQASKNMNLFKLAELKKDGYTIGIIDDPIEFGAMALLSNDPICANKTENINFFDGILKCNFPAADQILKILSPSDFRNSIQSLVGPKTALYGWHGEIGEIISKFDFMEFIEPSHNSIIGLDSVCILKSSTNIPTSIKLAKLLTSESMTKISAEKMQYFSPFKNLQILYNVKIAKLYQHIINKTKNEKPIILYPPKISTQEKLNQWWQKIRYE